MIRILTSLALALTLGCAFADDFDVHEWGYFVENGTRDPIEILESMPREVPNFRTWSLYGGRARALAARGDLDVDARPAALSLTSWNSTPGATRGWSDEDVTREILRRRYAPQPRSASSEPYLYFYSDRPIEVDVRVEFPGGAPYFWWPLAMVSGGSSGCSLEWRDVRVLPLGTPAALRPWRSGGALRLGLERARATASSPVKVGSTTEKYLFYEGTISTDAILARHLSWDGWHLVNLTSEPIHDVLVFAPGSDRPVRIDRIDPGREVVVAGGARGEEVWDEARLAALAGTAGLFADEAAAMAASIAGTGFFQAPGTRVLYRIPRETYDRVYPLSIAPEPRRLVRVGLVLSFDLDQGLRALLAKRSGTYRSRPEVRRALEAQLREVVASRIDRIEPLTEAMNEALALEALADLRRRVPAGDPAPALAARIEGLLDALGDLAEREAELASILRELSGSRRPRADAPAELAGIVDRLGTFPLSPEAGARFQRVGRAVRTDRPTPSTLDRVAELVGIVRADLAASRQARAADLLAALPAYLHGGGEATPEILAFAARESASEVPLVTTVGLPLEAIR